MVRYKNRYFVAEVEVRDRPAHAPLPLSNTKLKAGVLQKVQEIHGDFGLAAVTTGFAVKYCNPYTKIVLIRGRHGPHRLIGSVLPLVKTIDEHKIQFRILYLGSTMMKCFKFVRNHQMSTLDKFWNEMNTDKDRLLFKQALMDIKIAGDND